MNPLPYLLCCLLLLITSGLAQDAEPKKPAKKPDPALAPITDTPGLPRVLLIGDSISIGYTLPVRALLKDKANVHRVLENGGSTETGRAKLDKWLGSEKWDVIHFNWGLHDLKHLKDNKLDLAGPQVTSVEKYEQNLRALVTRLKATGAKLIWATTTQVPEGSAGRVEGDEAAYNAAALKIMKEEKVAIDDLHEFLSPRITGLQIPHNVHFTKEGYQALGEKVAEAIKAKL